MKKVFYSVIFLFAGLFATAHTVPEFNIIPEPESITPGIGVFKLSGADFYYSESTDPRLHDALLSFASSIQACTGKLARVKRIAGSVAGSRKGIYFLTEPSMSPESYRIEVNKKRTVVKASDYSGFLYAITTIKQMLPEDIYIGTFSEDVKWTLPCCLIIDKPRFAYRGLHLDVARHFFDVSQVKRYLDVAAMYKINRFHWHLTEDQGWRIEIKKYPRLTQVGSVRAGTQQTRDRSKNDGKPYGGFYTQDQIRDVVDYASKLGITVIPEIDLPGHMLGAMASYPWLGCTGGPYSVATRWGVSTQVLCAGKESTFVFLFDVLDELCELFPSEYIHIGGDECPKKEWESCPACQAKMDALGLVSDEKGTRGQKLQNYVTKRIQDYLAAKGRKIIGWDEILEGELSKGATIMSWRGSKGGIKAANMGFDVIMSPNTYCYFDYKQDTGSEGEYSNVGYRPAGLDAKKVYSYDPYEELDDYAASHILGVQANMWTEYIRNDKELYYMLIPRLQAISEVQWCSPKKRDYERLERKMKEKHLKVMDSLGYNYRPM